MTSFVEASHRRDRLYAFLNWEEEREGLSYLEDSLLNKINDPRAASKVTELLFPLKQTPPDRPLLAEEVRRHVAMGVFEGKKKLMDDFKEKIERFTSHLN
jgi:hypothetical protein